MLGVCLRFSTLLQGESGVAASRTGAMVAVVQPQGGGGRLLSQSSKYSQKIAVTVYSVKVLSS